MCLTRMFFERMAVREADATSCSDVNQAMVKISLPDDNDQIVAATYQLYVPSRAQLREE
jgi:hypothetical protein